MTVKQALRKARALIVKGWTQGVAARTKTGKPVDPSAKSAAKFCSIGAVQRVIPDDWNMRQLVYSVIYGVTKRSSVVEWNDAKGRKKPQVIRVFDRAIKAAP